MVRDVLSYACARAGVEPSEEVVARWAEALGVSGARLRKDWLFFESAVEKLGEVRQMMTEMQASAKRKEANKLKEAAEAAAKEADDAEAAMQATEGSASPSPSSSPPPSPPPPPPPPPTAEAPAAADASAEEGGFSLPKLPSLPKFPNPFGGGDK